MAEDTKSPLGEEEHSPITRELLDARLSGLKSDLRLMIIASVALNQFLGQVSVPKEIALPAIITAILLPAAKSALTFFGGHNGSV